MTLRKWVLFTLFGLVMATLMPERALRAQEVSIVPAYIEGKCHLIDTIWIDFDQYVAGVEAGSFALSFDQHLAHFVASLDTVVVPASLEGNVFVGYEVFAPDSIRVDIGVLQVHYSGPGHFFGIVIETGSDLDSTVFAIDRSTLRNSANENIPHTVVNDCPIEVLCCCEFHGDMYVDINNVIDALDFNRLLDYLFYGAPAPAQDPGCPHLNRSDVYCDGVPDVLDLNRLIDYLFYGGTLCDPCDCNDYPSDCPS